MYEWFNAFVLSVDLYLHSHSFRVAIYYSKRVKWKSKQFTDSYSDKTSEDINDECTFDLNKIKKKRFK